MTINIITVRVNDNTDLGIPDTRTADFIISNGGGTSYFYSKGGLALTGGMQAILDAMEADLWIEASAAGLVPTNAQKELAGQRAIYVADAGMVTAVFGGTPAEVQVNITALVNAAFPTANATVKTALVRLFTSSQFTTRFVGFSEDLV